MREEEEAPVFDDAVCSECEEPLPIGHIGTTCGDCTGDEFDPEDELTDEDFGEIEETCD
jgi:hypothetical protein